MAYQQKGLLDRSLTDEEEQEFLQWARDNAHQADSYLGGTHPESGVPYHPVILHEWERLMGKERVHIFGIGPGRVVGSRKDDLGRSIVTVRRDEDDVDHLCREGEFAKINRICVSWLGHPDRYVDDFKQTKALIESYVPGAVIGGWDKRGEDLDWKQQGSVRVRWERADWHGPDCKLYDGAIVVVCESKNSGRAG